MSFHYEKVEQVPQQCLLVAKILEFQPIFNGRGAILTPCKVIPLDSWDDARIFDIFSKNAAKFTGKKSEWHIRDFSRLEDDAIGKHIEQGIHLWLYNEDLGRCPLETLEKAYSNVYDAMRKGWIASNPDDYQDIMFKEDSEKFALFVKKGKIWEEDTLISFLASKFGLGRRKINCCSVWLKGSGYCYSDNLYMWINKEALSEVVEKFGFEFNLLIPRGDLFNRSSCFKFLFSFLERGFFSRLPMHQ